MNFRVWLRDVTRWERVVLRVFAWQQGIRGSGLVAKALLQNMFEGTERGYQGTPGQSQAGSGAPTRNTTLSTDVHTQLADGSWDTYHGAYSPYRYGGDIETGAAAAQSASLARPADGAAASAAFSQRRLPAAQERVGAAFALGSVVRGVRRQRCGLHALQQWRQH